MKFTKLLDIEESINLSPTEKFITNIINENIEEFVETEKIDVFCKKQNFTGSSLNILAKKLGFKSASELKLSLTKKYYKNIGIKEVCKDIFESKDIPKKYKTYLNDFINRQIYEFRNLDWHCIDKLATKILYSKTVYFLSSTEFNESYLEMFCFSNNIKFISIKSDWKIQFVDDLHSEKSNSVLIIAKVRNYIKDTEKKIVKRFAKMGIESFIFIPTKDIGLNMEHVNIFSFGSILENNKNNIEEIFDYKITFEIVMDIILKTLTDEFQSKKLSQ